ncbi:MAG: GyrI-like domain-containing protein [Flavobacteriaceae bacterium]|nr:GyrI-like domain-containing protein [Flavobacteriaceae bacterium]
MTSKSKKTIYLLVVLFVGFLVWYFFLNPFDYVVKFKAKASPGTVYQQVEDWVKWEGYAMDTTTTVLEKTPFSQMKQRVAFINTTWDLNWTFEAENDSVTQVTIGIKDNKFSLRHRLEVPFRETDFEKSVRYSFVKFKNRLNHFLDNRIRVKIAADTLSPEIFMVYVPLKSHVKEKALNMMRHDYEVRVFIDSVLGQKVRMPIMEITHWDVEQNTITYNYGFPIDKTDSLPQSDKFLYKQLTPHKSIRSIYNGNYRTSEHAWYALWDYAKRNQIETQGSVIEIYYNNPYNGGNELEWQTDILMPLKEN